MRLLILSCVVLSSLAIAVEPSKEYNSRNPLSFETNAYLQDPGEAEIRKAVAEMLESDRGSKVNKTKEVKNFRSSTDEIMTAAFNDAKVPDCLHSEGLKRQTTFFLTGYIALPFVVIAKMRGKCK